MAMLKIELARIKWGARLECYHVGESIDGIETGATQVARRDAGSICGSKSSFAFFFFRETFFFAYENARRK